MNWEALDVSLDMDSGHGKLEIVEGDLVVRTTCSECEKQRRSFTYVPSWASNLKGRLEAARLPGERAIIERNLVEIIKWTCLRCQGSVRGQLELRIPQKLIDEAREKRFRDKALSTFLGFIEINSSIKGGRFPRHPYTLYYSHVRTPLNALSIWCGSCGEKYMPFPVSQKYLALMNDLERFFDGNRVDLQPIEIDEKLHCSKCGNELHFKATIRPEIPKSRKALLEAFKQFQRLTIPEGPLTVPETESKYPSEEQPAQEEHGGRAVIVPGGEEP